MTKTNEEIKSVEMKDLESNKIIIDRYLEEIRQYLVGENWTEEAIENAMKVPLGIPEQIFKIDWIK